MNAFRYIKKYWPALLFSLVLMQSPGFLLGQTTNISGASGNEFSKVLDWEFIDGPGIQPDTLKKVKVADPSKFSRGDFVILYAVKGLDMDASGDETPPYSNTGQYCMLLIDTIMTDTVVFTESANFADPSESGNPYWSAQLIKVPVYTNAVVDGTLTTSGWDPATGEGGFLALFVKNKLTLNADIDMTGKGFRGADPTGDNYTGSCYTGTESGFLENFIAISEDDSAGLKGEGPLRSNFTRLRGLGHALTGGGGGSARYSGGGGGGNYRAGGKGGGQSSLCMETTATAGEGGGFLGDGKFGYRNTSIYWDLINRVFFGGGGGTGTQTPTDYIATPGGNGGGIVFIIAQTIESDGIHGIVADGESVTDLATGPGGGGGGGGVILLQVNNYENTLNLSAIGGKGGDTGNPLAYTGPGGGGGGGVYWVASSSPLLNYDNTTVPQGGANMMGDNALPGTRSAFLTGLESPINGILLNLIPEGEMVCSDVIPPTIDGSIPRLGENTSGIILWEESTDMLSWNDASGVNDQEDYSFTAPLANTMHFRRVVEIDGFLDTSIICTYEVLPAIQGNTITTDDLIACDNQAPNISLLPSANLSGAYTSTDTVFTWEQWYPAAPDEDSIGDLRSQDVPVLDVSIADTYFFRRIVQSGVCRDTSNTITITVLDSIRDNTISTRDTLCWGQQPDLFEGSTPAGGDEGNYIYDWQLTLNGKPVIMLGDDTEDLDYVGNYTEDTNFTEDAYIRRVVYSGTDSSCVSWTDVLRIVVLDTILGNTIEAPDLLCQDAHTDFGVTGEDVTEGDGNYTYKWQTSIDNSNWTTREKISVNDSLYIESYGETTYVRREVISGADSVCRSFSNVETIEVLPMIQGNSIPDEMRAVCENDAYDLPLEGNEVTGGDNTTYTYQWISSTNGDAGSWTQIDGAIDFVEETGQLSDTTHFKLIAYSSVCVDTTSETLIYAVPDSISNNIIYQGVSYDEICFGESLAIEGSQPEFGSDPSSPDYNYRWIKYEPLLASPGDTIGTDQSLAAYSFTEDTAYFRRLVSDMDALCKSLSEPLKIHVRTLPVAVLNTLPDPIICEDTIYLVVDITNVESTNTEHQLRLSYTSSEGTGELTASGDSRVIVPHYPETDDSTTYVYSLLEVVDAANCEALSLSGNPSIKVYEKPKPAILTETLDICGESLVIQGSSRNGATGAQWLQLDPVNGMVSFADDTMMNTVMSLVTNENYDTTIVRLGWKLSTPRCDSTAVKTITFYEDPTVTEVLQDTFAFYTLESVSLAPYVDEVDAGTGYWLTDESGVEMISEHEATGFIYEQPHVFTWEVVNGACGPYQDELVVIQHDLRLFEGFSPDNDTYNQEFVIAGLANAGAEFSVIIYNSWGTKVLQVSQSEAELRMVELDGEMVEEYIIWDGTLGGGMEPAPEGTYYYTLNYSINGEEFEPRKGFVVLRR